MATITVRSDKGSPLTQAEVDQNFINLNTDKLDTSGLALGSAASPSLKFTGDPNTGIYSPGADQVALATAGTGRLFVDASGRVGIGTASPSAALDVQGGGQQILNQGGTSFLEIGTGTATNQAAYIDFTTDTTYTDYGLRLIRDGAGANAVSQLVQRGTGDLSLRCLEAAPLTFYTTNTERARIDSSGRLLVGTSSNRSSRVNTINIDALLQIESNVEAAQAITRWSADVSSSRLHLQKGRGTIAAPTTVANNDGLGEISFSGYDGANMTNGARIECFVDSIPGINDMPGRLVFSTTTHSAASPTERMRINFAGNVGIGTVNPAVKLAVAGTIRAGAWDGAANTDDAVIEIGVGAISNRNSYIDFVSDTIYADYGLRIIRGNTGANTNSVIAHKGTGNLNLLCEQAGAIGFLTSNTERMQIKPNGVINIAATTVYADNAAATAGGLVAGDIYRKSDGTLMIRY